MKTFAFSRIACMFVGAIGFAGELQCAAATLTTTDGTTYKGNVALRGGDIVEISDTNAGLQRVPLSKVAALNVGRPPAQPDPIIAEFKQRQSRNIPDLHLLEILPATLPSTQPSSLENGWLQADIGKALQAGNGSISGSNITVGGSGWGFWGEEDSGHFVYRPISGDFDCIVHLKTLPTEESPFNAGLVVRQSLDADGPMAALTARAGDPPRITNRPLALHDKHSAASLDKPYTWLRLVRSAEGVAGFCSVDGTTWVPAGWVQLAMGSDVFIGMGCAASSNQEVDTAAFDHFSLTTGMYGPLNGLMLTDGTRLPAELHQFDGKFALYAIAQQPEQTLTGDALAAILREPLPVPINRITGTNKTGLYLNSGDFIDTGGDSGGALSVHDGRINITSIILGQQSFSMDQIAMANIAPTHPNSTIRISTRDGALYCCDSITTTEGSFVLTTSLGKIKVGVQDVVEFRTIADTTFEQQ